MDVVCTSCSLNCVDCILTAMTEMTYSMKKKSLCQVASQVDHQSKTLLQGHTNYCGLWTPSSVCFLIGTSDSESRRAAWCGMIIMGPASHMTLYNGWAKFADQLERLQVRCLCGCFAFASGIAQRKACRICFILESQC